MPSADVKSHAWIKHLIAFTLQGDIGGLTTYTSKRGKHVAFPLAPPRVPESARQANQRERFKSAATKWAALTPAQRLIWLRAARLTNLSISGWNLFLATLLRQDTSYALTISRATGLQLETEPTL